MFKLYALAGWLDVVWSVLTALMVYGSACDIVKIEQVCRMNKKGKLKEWFYINLSFQHGWLVIIRSCILLCLSGAACLAIECSIRGGFLVLMFYLLVILFGYLFELFYWPIFYFSIRKKYSKEIKEMEGEVYY